jgi:hypothetical protein
MIRTFAIALLVALGADSRVEVAREIRRWVSWVTWW